MSYEGETARYAQGAFERYEKQHPGCFDTPFQAKELEKLKAPNIRCVRLSLAKKRAIREDFDANLHPSAIAKRRGVSLDGVRSYCRRLQQIRNASQKQISSIPFVMSVNGTSGADTGTCIPSNAQVAL